MSKSQFCYSSDKCTKFMQIKAQDLHKVNFASIYGKSLRLRFKYDIYETYSSQDTHGGCWARFLIRIGIYPRPNSQGD